MRDSRKSIPIEDIVGEKGGYIQQSVTENYRRSDNRASDIYGSNA